MVDKTWVGASGGNWNSSANWSPSGIPTTGDNVFFTGSGTYSVGASAAPNCANFTVTTGTVTFTYTGTYNVAGNISWDNGCVVSLNGTISATGSAKTIQTYDAPISNFTFVSGTRTLTTGLTVTNTFSFGASGTFNLSSYNLSVGVITFTASSTGFFNFNSGALYLTKSQAGNLTNFNLLAGVTFDKVGDIYVTRGGPDTSYNCEITQPAGYSFNWYFTNGAYLLGSFLTTLNSEANIVDFTGYSGTWRGSSAATTYISGNLTLSSTMTCTANTGTLVFDGSNQYITTNGTSLNRPSTFTSAAHYLNDNTAFNYTVTVSSGTLDLQANKITCNNFVMSGSAILNFNGSSYTSKQPEIEIYGSGATAFSRTAGIINSTYSDPTDPSAGPAPLISMTSASAKTFAGGSADFKAILSNDGAGALTITGANQFWDITNSVTTSMVFPASTIQNTYCFTANNLTMTSDTPDTQYTIRNANSSGSIIQGANNLSIRDAAFLPAPPEDGSSPYLWYGGESVANNQGNVTGIAFIPNNKKMYVITNTSITSWPFPSDWNYLDNEIHAWGAGGGGGGATSGTTVRQPGGGGGGGGYAKVVNYNQRNTGNTITFTIGVGGAGGGIAGTYASRLGGDGTNTVITTTSGMTYTGGGGIGGLGGGFGGGGLGGGAGGVGATANGGAGGGASEYTGASNYYYGGGGGGGAGGNAGVGGGGDNGRGLSTINSVYETSGAGGGGSGGQTANSNESPGGNNNRGFGGGTGNTTVRPILAARAGGGGAAWLPGSIGTDVWNTLGGAGGSGGYGIGINFGGGGGGGYAATSSNRTGGRAGGNGAIVIVYTSYTPQPNFLQVFDIWENKYKV
jgi:hypothetical protein